MPAGHRKMALEGASARAMSARGRRVTPSPQMMRPSVPEGQAAGLTLSRIAVSDIAMWREVITAAFVNPAVVSFDTRDNAAFSHQVSRSAVTQEDSEVAVGGRPRQIRT